MFSPAVRALVAKWSRLCCTCACWFSPPDALASRPQCQLVPRRRLGPCMRVFACGRVCVRKSLSVERSLARVCACVWVRMCVFWCACMPHLQHWTRFIFPPAVRALAGKWDSVCFACACCPWSSSALACRSHFQLMFTMTRSVVCESLCVGCGCVCARACVFVCACTPCLKPWPWFGQMFSPAGRALVI